MQNNTLDIREGIVDLNELFSILRQRKKLILGMTAFFTMLAIVYSLFIAKPVYAVKAIIEVGQIDNKSIDNINNIQQKLAYMYQVNATGIKRPLPLVKSITALKKSKNILSIIIHGNNNKEALKYIETVISEIETQYKEKTDAYTDNQKSLIKLVQEDMKESSVNLLQMKKELGTYNQKIISLTSEDAALAGIFALQIGQKETQLQELKKYISSLKSREQELKLSITPLKMKPTHIIGEIETLEKPIEPKKKLIVIVAFIVGLIFAVFLAFFLEFLKAIKKEEIEVNQRSV